MAVASEPVSVLILDADPVQRRLISSHIEARGDRRYRARACATAGEAAALTGGPHLLIADLDSLGGADTLGKLAAAGGPVIATSARGSVTTAVAAMRAGAVDYLPKPIGAQALLERLDAALAGWRADTGGRPGARPVAGKRLLPTPVSPGEDFEGFIGRSPAMRAVYDQIERIAPSRAPVFITGESGSGKEVCAEAIHARSGRDRPFVAINCSAIPKDLIESEVFGHVRGAFTGAVENRMGAAEMADGGTLFLDEIGEMALGLQAKLLRFIQTGALRRVGDTETRRVDVRFVCATNRDPQAEVEAGTFRADLFYRLSVLPIVLPALRERSQDILALAEAFLTRFAAEEGRAFRRFAPAAAARLAAYRWPGNVRELQNAIRRIVVLNDAVEVTEAMLPAEIGDAGSPVAVAAIATSTARVEPFRDQERRIIETALAAFDGNINRAAAALQLNPSTIYRKKLAWQAGEV